jgi:selenocysteine lyase/cysteine desulfurase
VPAQEPGAERHSHIVAVPLPAERLATAPARLQAQGVTASLRAGFVRFGLDFYNDEEDVERAVRALA